MFLTTYHISPLQSTAWEVASRVFLARVNPLPPPEGPQISVAQVGVRLGEEGGCLKARPSAKSQVRES